ncbi:MAG: ATP-binding protein [Bacilli bacterium]|nr:ATP-binding protein [Bacilli bacterium]
MIFLKKWKNNVEKKPLIVTGARQTGKTTSIREFGKNYSSFIEINFLLNPIYNNIINNNYETSEIIKEISLINPKSKFIAKDTLIFFDEIQEFPDIMTALKSFFLDGRFDVICSGSLLGVHYKKINSVPVGFKEDYIMHSLDFEEFMWAKGYTDEQIDELFNYMKKLEPLPAGYLIKLRELFRDYLFVGGMPEAVNSFVVSGLFSNAFKIQKHIFKDYEDDITKYVEGLDYAKVVNVYRHITSQLSKDNHKFQISKLSHGARNREYFGVEEWLKDAGIINISYKIKQLGYPLSTYEMDDHFRIYFADHSLFISSLDEESKEDLIANDNFDLLNGALYESLVSEALVKAGYNTHFYKNDKENIELDFVIRVKMKSYQLKSRKKRSHNFS